MMIQSELEWFELEMDIKDNKDEIIPTIETYEALICDSLEGDTLSDQKDRILRLTKLIEDGKEKFDNGWTENSMSIELYGDKFKKISNRAELKDMEYEISQIRKKPNNLILTVKLPVGCLAVTGIMGFLIGSTVAGMLQPNNIGNVGMNFALKGWNLFGAAIVEPVGPIVYTAVTASLMIKWAEIAAVVKTGDNINIMNYFTQHEETILRSLEGTFISI